MANRFYARFSPRPGAEACESCTVQLEELRRKIGQGVEYLDEALSGADHERPALLQLISELRRGDVVYVRDFSRLSRDAHHLLGLALDITAKGAKLVSLREGEYMPTDPERQLMFAIHAAIAQYDRAKKKERTRQRMLEHQAKGRRMSKNLPYGWEPDPDSDHICRCRACQVKLLIPAAKAKTETCPSCGGPLTAIPSLSRPSAAELEAIERTKHLADIGLTPRQIATRLDQEGYPARGKQWQHTLVYRILKRSRQRL